jgi:hypothetical protein
VTLPGGTPGAPVERIQNLIGNLDLGKSVAEFDEALETYFIETNAFRELISDKIDIIAGDKGTGKTAIYRILHKKYPTLPSLDATEVLAAFNPTGNPVFQKLGEHAIQEEGEYILLWKLYFLSLVGNWLLSVWDGNFTPSMLQLDQLLKGLDIRSKDDAPVNIFARTLSRIGKLFQWRAAEVEITASDTGIPLVTRASNSTTRRARSHRAKTSESNSPSASSIPVSTMLRCPSGSPSAGSTKPFRAILKLKFRHCARSCAPTSTCLIFQRSS